MSLREPARWCLNSPRKPHIGHYSGHGGVMRKVGLVLCPDFQVMCFVALSAFEIANKNSGETLYDLHVLSERGGKLRSSFGMDVTTEAFADDEFDTLLIAV